MKLVVFLLELILLLLDDYLVSNFVELHVPGVQD